MQTFMKLLLVLMISALMSGVAFAEKGGKGKGAGGARGDHVSDMGMEKGKAYAGSKRDSEASEDDDSDDDEGKKEKKEKKEKKAKKEKNEKKGKKEK
jgi:Pin2-interacting protein X1